ncbi:MAG TPA: KEOPS complex subunit Pcc1 [Candidatus Thalassarchaeaceae archaeon]|nr:KEOPS complex subunit Pcc1 [Candidatus Thalassarchaeaceae archaeon]
MCSITEIIWNGGRDEAESLLAAISPDDPGDFEASIVEQEGSVSLKIVIKSGSLGSARSTVDDILACLAAAESGMRAIG